MTVISIQNGPNPRRYPVFKKQQNSHRCSFSAGATKCFITPRVQQSRRTISSALRFARTLPSTTLSPAILCPFTPRKLLDPCQPPLLHLSPPPQRAQRHLVSHCTARAVARHYAVRSNHHGACGLPSVAYLPS